MPVFRIPHFSNPEFLLWFDPERLVELLREHAGYLAGRGFALPPPGRRPRLDLEALARVFADPGPDAPMGLADALHFVHGTANRDAMFELFEAFGGPERLGVDGPLGATAADVALRAWLADPERVQRVHAQRAVESMRRFDLFQADADPVPEFPTPPDEKVAALGRALDRMVVTRGKGAGLLRVTTCPGDPECLFLIRRPDPLHRAPAFRGGRAGSVLFHPLRYDVVGYDRRTGTLRVHADRQGDVPVYRQQFGKHLFGDMEFFPAKGRYTLEPLVDAHDAGCLAWGDVAGIKSVRLTEVELSWHGPYDGATVLRAKDVFADLRRRDERLPPGATPSRATFAIRFRRSRADRTVTVIPPNVAQYCRDDDGPLVDEWLRARGFIRPRTNANKGGDANGRAEPLLQGR